MLFYMTRPMVMLIIAKNDVNISMNKLSRCNTTQIHKVNARDI